MITAACNPQGCSPWFQRLDDATVELLSAVAVGALVVTCLAVLALRRRPRAHRWVSFLLGVQVLALLGAAAAVAAHGQ